MVSKSRVLFVSAACTYVDGYINYKFCNELCERYQKRVCASKTNSESNCKYTY